jgi:hypothetical protein
MKQQKRKYKVFNILLMFILMFLLMGEHLVQAQSMLDQAIEKALQQTRTQLSLRAQDAADLSVVATKTTQPNDLAVTAYAVKILDQRAGQVYGYWFDKDLRAISEEQAFTDRAAAYGRAIRWRNGHDGRKLLSLSAEYRVQHLPIANR